jgi:diacylglycerol kinase family enzyme
MPSFRKALLLYNPKAGRAHQRQQSELRAAAQVFRAAGVEVELEATRAPGEGGRQAQAAMACGFDAIFACGGDGTVYDVLQGMVHGPEQVALGVLPLGTANVLANDLGLPNDVQAAARAALGYVPRRLAAGQLVWPGGQPTYFSVAAGIGAHAGLIYDASARSKRHGGFATYYVAGFSRLFLHEFVPFGIEIALPDGSARCEQVLELVAMRVRSFGRWLSRWHPGGALECDYLQLITIKPCSRWSLFRYAVSAIVRGTATEAVTRAARVEFIRALRVRCRPLPGVSSTGIRAQADGEVLKGLPAEIAIVPQALTLLMPSKAGRG